MSQPNIADNLKKHRKNLGWSLSKAATETGVSKAMLGQIERSESSPTIATLWKIASGFHLPLTTFFEPTNSPHDFIKFKDGLKFKTLFAYDPKLGSEMFVHYLDPHQSHQSEAHEHGVQEDIVVLTGEIDILTNGIWQSLKVGDTLRFAADQAHGYRNPTNKIATFHNILHYPKHKII